jgi:tryptophan synthase alpha chain
MNRIEKVFSDLAAVNRAAFIAYYCAGDPDFETSLAACRTLIESGVDILEIGVPFSDPLADGLTNQLAAQRALESGMTGDQVFELVRRIREFSQIPIVFYTYYNLVFAQGSQVYVERAAEAGVDALLTLDLPPEEADEHLAACQAAGLGTVFIVAPTTPVSRIERIAQATTSFIYYVSREGVTGEQATVATGVQLQVDRIRQYTELPVVVGFGVSTAEHVQALSKLADGVVVGSAIVKCVAEGLGDEKAILQALSSKVTMLTQDSVLQRT